MDREILLQKLDRFCPPWLKRADSSLAINEIFQQTISQVLPGLLGIKIEHLDNEKVIGSIPYSHQTANVLGYMHGGAIFTLGDTLAGTYLWFVSKPEQFAVTVRSEIRYIKPLKEGNLRCTVTEKSRNDRTVTLEAVFDVNGQTHCLMTVDFLLIESGPAEK